MNPIRPSGRDLSLKNPNSTYALLWFPLSSPIPHTASQTEKDAMEWHLFSKTCEVMLLLKEAAPSAYAYAVTQMPVITTRLGIGQQYEGQLQKPGGAVWDIGPNGRHYSIERNILKRFRAAVLKKSTVVPLLATRPDLRDLLDLNSSLTGPADFTLGQPPRKVDQVRENAFILDTRKRMPLLTAEQKTLLEATHEAHHRVSAWRRDPEHVPLPPPGIVQAGHEAFEASARTEEELHFFQVKPFLGVEHPDWTRTELGLWASIQDAYHHRWMEAIRAGDWAATREADSAHLWAHLCMNFGPECWLFLFPCGNGPKIDSCGKFLPREALPILRGRLNL